MADADGTGARQVTENGVDAENPAMSADGAWIVYASGNPSAPGIWKIRPDGSDVTHLLKGSFQIPDLSPVSNWIAATESGLSTAGVRPVRIVRLDDGSTVGEISVPGQGGNIGRGRWMPDGRTFVTWGENDAHEKVLFRQPIVPGRDTRGERAQIAVGDDERKIESFAISPVDGRIVVSATRGDRDLMMVEGIPGVGASLKKREP